MKSVAIIGAGAAGLTCLKSLLEYGIQPVVFERSDRSGGLWKLNQNERECDTAAYRSLITNTSKQMMAFSDFPFEKEVADFPSREVVSEYLKNYTEQFNLAQYIQFNTSVIRADKETDGRFVVEVESGGSKETHTFDWLIVANGRHEKTSIPEIDGLVTFPGTVLHSRDYFSPESFEGTKVLVVGAGSSAIDIASEVAEVAPGTFLSMRSPSWLVPRFIDDKAYDLLLTKLSASLPKVVREKAFRSKLMKAYKQYDDEAIRQYFGKPDHSLDLEKQRFVPNDLLLKRLEQGKLKVKPVIQSISRDQVTFEDGSSETIDTIIFATGYQIDIPFMESSFTGVENNYIPLYQQIFSPVTPNLAMCGMCYIVGPILPALEMQGRYIAEVIAGHTQLPSAEIMEQEVEKHRVLCEERKVNPMRVQTLTYLDTIAQIIDVAPKVWRNPGSLLQLLTGPVVAARYRLNGRQSKKAQARKVLKDLTKRI
ncbi:NAD(P)-binding domain-containing protein [Prolixibacter denitrificans]|uniref:Dimethylaniline monooxygenase n=1 Tax=Prolixibacter denitrificans TaxID=1541063 RepID=A0A2P8CE94_9BACT|nr:NAD(P)-binding domain-containing protein [Prolixibacter denitrificans]PSK83297.1 dimethylaniline monooxygenase (N-oxide forming) [Prolixibacter denitrificans]GET21819.1 dimethylaniline monooxygenase [Prolixibacter denitrificans]